MNYQEALLRLKAGNDRFVHGDLLHPFPDTAARRRLRQVQHPIAAVLGCSDSQVPPELIFDQGLGSLFVIRVPGHVATPITLAAVDYARSELKVELVVVLGHHGCHTLSVALQAAQAGGPVPAGLEPIVRLIVPALAEFVPNSGLGLSPNAAVEAHVNWVVRQIVQCAGASSAAASPPVHIVGAICETATGTVRFLD